MEHRLYRSRTDRMISGVCGGVAREMNLDPTLVRVIVVVLTLITQGGFAIAYLVMAFAIPEEPLVNETVTGSVPAPPAAGATEVEKTMAENMSEQTAQDTAPSAPPVPPVPPAPQVTAPYVPPSTPAGPSKSSGRGGVGFGILLVLVGLALLANQFVPDFDLWRYWPVAVIVVGIFSVFRGLRG